MCLTYRTISCSVHNAGRGLQPRHALRPTALHKQAKKSLPRLRVRVAAGSVQ